MLSSELTNVLALMMIFLRGSRGESMGGCALPHKVFGDGASAGHASGRRPVKNLDLESDGRSVACNSGQAALVATEATTNAATASTSAGRIAFASEIMNANMIIHLLSRSDCCRGHLRCDDSRRRAA